jgi:hypothetical protein
MNGQAEIGEVRRLPRFWRGPTPIFWASIEFGMEWLRFPPGEEPRVLTAAFCKEFGGCASCPGIARAGKLDIKGEDPEQLVFCIHDCHKKTEVM